VAVRSDSAACSVCSRDHADRRAAGEGRLDHREVSPAAAGVHSRNAPDSATRAKLRALFGNQDEEIRALLTPDQQKVWDQNVTEMRNRMQQRAPGDR
jgi:hypothetical protein